MVFIELNLDVIANADWVIDLGPEGGSRGGTVVAQGTPEQVASCADSHTGRYLARYVRPDPDAAPLPPRPGVPTASQLRARARLRGAERTAGRRTAKRTSSARAGAARA